MTKNQRLYNELRKFVDTDKVQEYDNEFFGQKSPTYKFLIPYFNRYMNLELVKDKMTDPKAQIHLEDQLKKFQIHNNKDWQKIKIIKKIKVISLVVLGLATVGCSKDELVDVSCVDLEAGEAYRLSLRTSDDSEEMIGAYTYYSPVCGCNGKTYPNDHFAKLEGVISFTVGDCEN